MRKFLNRQIDIKNKALFGVEFTQSGKVWQHIALSAVQTALFYGISALIDYAVEKAIEEATELSERDVKRYLSENNDLCDTIESLEKEIEILQKENAWLTASKLVAEETDEYNPSLNF